MPQTRESALYAQRLILEYNRARKLLRKYFKKRHDPDEARAKIKEIIDNMTVRQSKVIGYTLNDAFRRGTKEGNKEISNATISAAASSVSLGFDLTKVSDMHLHKITKETIGKFGEYNEILSKGLTLEYDRLIADNTLINKLAQTGWTPAIEKALEKRGVSAEVIALAKNQTTSAKMITILEQEGIKSGRHPREIAKLLQPHISNYFGNGGVVINNVGKYRRAIEVNADGSHKWVQKKVTRVFRTTPKNYADLISRSSMVNANNEGRFQSLQQSKLVDHYISVSVLDAATCNLCAGMHSLHVSKSEGPAYHPRCRCSLLPVYRKDSGLSNKDPKFYQQQSDKWFLKQHDLKEFNLKMPAGSKLKFSSLLPEDAITETLPSKEAILEIRRTILK